MTLVAAITNTSFREKTAWVMATILIGAGAVYLNMVAGATRALGQTAPPIIGFVIAYVVLVVIASVVLMSALAAASPREADAPADEREKIIADKAGNWAGYVISAPVLGGLWHYAVHMDGNMLFHIAFASLMLGQIAECVFQIILYRRGA